MTLFYVSMTVFNDLGAWTALSLECIRLGNVVLERYVTLFGTRAVGVHFRTKTTSGIECIHMVCHKAKTIASMDNLVIYTIMI
jgi:hypothetical protein